MSGWPSGLRRWTQDLYPACIGEFSSPRIVGVGSNPTSDKPNFFSTIRFCFNNTRTLTLYQESIK